MKRSPFCAAFRRRSGSVNSRDPRVVVWYRVLGEMPWEALESALREAEQAPPYRFTDGWRARKARDVVRLLDTMRRGN